MIKTGLQKSLLPGDFNCGYLRELLGCTLYTGMMITYHGYNNPVYHMHKNVGVYYAWQNMVFRFIFYKLLDFSENLKMFQTVKSFNLYPLFLSKCYFSIDETRCKKIWTELNRQKAT